MSGIQLGCGVFEGVLESAISVMEVVEVIG